MKQTIAIRHVAFEDLGLIDPILRARGHDIVYLGAWSLDRQHVETADLVVFLGGPISVNDTAEYPFLAQEIALTKARIKARIDAKRPTLGTCLGAQSMARAVGGAVRPGPKKEIGWRPAFLTDAGRASVLAPLEDGAVLHWHGEVCALPSGIESLAHTLACAKQAFIPGPGCLALQFHVEAGARTAEALDKGDRAGLGRLTGETRLFTRCIAMQQWTMPSTRAMTSGRLANRKRSGYGTLSTHWRTGCSGKTSSTSSAALSAMRRAPQLGEKNRVSCS